MCASPLRYIHCKQSAWYRGCKLLRATPPPSSLTRLAPPHLHYSYRHQNSAFGGSSMCDWLGAGADWGKKVAWEFLSDRPTQYTARGPLSTRRVAHSMDRAYRTVSGLLGKIPIHLTLFWMITKKLHQICMFVF